MAELSILKILQAQGYGSRKECHNLIRSGKVLVNGLEEKNPEHTYQTKNLFLTVEGEKWACREKLYVALNKGTGYECSRKPSHHPSVLELLPAIFIRRGIQPVGRLDWDTRGLLLLSDDGAFIHAVDSPKKRVFKTYRAKTSEAITENQLDVLSSGVLFHGESTVLRAITCKALGKYELELTIGEGKYHQVKRMIAATGNHCVALKRSAIGALRLDNLELQENHWCLLETAQTSLVFNEPEFLPS